jgi:hypothetical protein
LLIFSAILFLILYIFDEPEVGIEPTTHVHPVRADSRI